MLKHWDSHAEYQHFISEAVALLNPSQLKKLYSMCKRFKTYRRCGSNDAVERLYKGTMFQGDGHGNRNTGEPGADTAVIAAP